MKIIYLFLLLSISVLYPQESKWIKIEYTQVLGGQITKSQLEFNNTESLYTYGNYTKIDTTSQNMTYIITDDIGSVVYKNKAKKIMFTRQADGKEVILINDCFPDLSWEILNETKKVASIILRKATTTFRGRDYIAWFDENIPSDNGPLKMGGLPGLIIEMLTVDGYLNISLDKVYTDENKPNSLERILNKFDRKITQKEWVIESKDKIENFIAKIKAKQNRETSFDITFDEPLERKFEWEK